MRLRLLALAALLASSCYSPSFENGRSLCSPDGQCPDGYFCAADNHCYQNGTTPPDLTMAAPEDLSMPDLMTGCSSGQHLCSGACVSNDDPNNCGVSCSPCVAMAHAMTSCDGTSCQYTCLSGYKPCNGVCVSTTDNTDCNGTCNAGFHLCGAMCVLDSDANNCGKRCTPCPGTACVATPDGGVVDDGGVEDFVCAPATCTDGKKDGNETDTDCGGSCPPCANGKMCLVQGDCTSMVCSSSTHTCSTPTCSDGVQNGTETDTDCGGGSCPACADNKKCKANTDCVDMNCMGSPGVCTPKAQGAACGGNAECATGNCVDSVCCNTPAASCSGCKQCNLAGFLGTCKPVPMGSDPHTTCALSVPTCQLAKCAGDGTCNAPVGTSCGASTCTAGTETDQTCGAGGVCQSPTTMCSPFSCGATTCNNMCNTSTNAGCDASHYCATVSSCATKLPNGSTCTQAFQCANGFCTQGQSGLICASLACPLACSVVNAAGTACVAATSGTNPKSDCSASVAMCKQATCNGGTGTHACDVTDGTACANPTCSNSTGNETDTLCLGGTCQAPTTKSCNGFACNGNVCGTSCVNDLGCDSTHYCTNPTCTPRANPGGSCSANDQCLSNRCGVGGTGSHCCTAACSPTTAPCGATDCDPSGACIFAASTTACGASLCSGSTFTPAPLCNGSGTCNPAGAMSTCANGFKCNSNGLVCNTSCPSNDATGDMSCQSGFFCNGSVCVAAQASPAACTRSSQCSGGGGCVDGFCCNASCTGGCQACANARTGQPNGTCANIPSGMTGNGCGVYFCAGGSTCPTTCPSNDTAGDASCMAGNWCNGTNCTAALGTGSTCNRNSMCINGTCAGTCN
jgi:hypothetical protein